MSHTKANLANAGIHNCPLEAAFFVCRGFFYAFQTSKVSVSQQVRAIEKCPFALSKFPLKT